MAQAKTRRAPQRRPDWIIPLIVLLILVAVSAAVLYTGSAQHQQDRLEAARGTCSTQYTQYSDAWSNCVADMTR